MGRAWKVIHPVTPQVSHNSRVYYARAYIRIISRVQNTMSSTTHLQPSVLVNLIETRLTCTPYTVTSDSPPRAWSAPVHPTSSRTPHPRTSFHCTLVPRHDPPIPFSPLALSLSSSRAVTDWRGTLSDRSAPHPRQHALEPLTKDSRALLR